MIAVDTSVLMAIVLGEPSARRCLDALENQTQILISAATLAEALIVAGRRGLHDEMVRLIDVLDLEVVPVTAATARRVAAAYEQWGKGVHPASLNYGDCFAYDLAKTQGCPLLFIGDDIARTDLGRSL